MILQGQRGFSSGLGVFLFQVSPCCSCECGSSGLLGPFAKSVRPRDSTIFCDDFMQGIHRFENSFAPNYVNPHQPAARWALLASPVGLWTPADSSTAVAPPIFTGRCDGAAPIAAAGAGKCQGEVTNKISAVLLVE